MTYKNIIKRSLAELLINPFTGRVIKLFYPKQIRIDGLFISTDNPYITFKTIAQLFFNAYESSERRFIKKYLKKRLDVIELGASMGVVTNFIATSKPPRIFAIEANPNLINVIHQNLKLNNVSNCFVINAAISDNNLNKNVFFIPGNSNLTGKLSVESTEDALMVESITLSALLIKYEISEFVLISDIEGAEIYYLLNDSIALMKCKQIIIETHDTNYNNVNYVYQDLKDIICNLGFELIDEYGPNYVFERAFK